MVKLLLGQAPCYVDMRSGEISVVRVAERKIQSHRQNTYIGLETGCSSELFWMWWWILKLLSVPGTESWSTNQVTCPASTRW